jgi:hypothetical protein
MEEKKEKSRRSLIGLGLISGFAAALCCVSPVLLALFGVVTATGAVALGNRLYDDYSLFFILGGAFVFSIGTTFIFRKSPACRRRPLYSIFIALGTAVVTYGFLYFLTTALGNWASSVAQ